MGWFTAVDGTRLAYHEVGAGEPEVCLPGGPMQDSRYLGDLGGLSANNRLIRLDLRGTGQSAVPEDTASYRCDRLVDDVEALRRHIGLDRLDLLAHSAGANLAVLYAARHPERVRRLVLVTPSLVAVGIEISASDRREVAQLRRDEPWFPAGSAALARIAAGDGKEADWDAVSPFLHGRWDDAARAQQETDASQRNDEAAAIFGAEGAFDPAGSRAGLATLAAPASVLAGELDVNTPPSRAAKLASLFLNSVFLVQGETAHYPWLDNADAFAAAASSFLKR